VSWWLMLLGGSLQYAQWLSCHGITIESLPWINDAELLRIGVTDAKEREQMLVAFKKLFNTLEGEQALEMEIELLSHCDLRRRKMGSFIPEGFGSEGGSDRSTHALTGMWQRKARRE